MVVIPRNEGRRRVGVAHIAFVAVAGGCSRAGAAAGGAAGAGGAICGAAGAVAGWTAAGQRLLFPHRMPNEERGQQYSDAANDPG